jgi:hypothetical protein
MTDWITQTQEWSDCRLVVAANAALMLGLDPPRPDRDDDRAWWEKLVRMSGAECGAALTPERADVRMGVVALRYASPWTAVELLPPTGIGIHDPKAGFHCVLVAEQGADSIGLVGFEFENRVRRFTHEEVEALLPKQGNVNRRADLFILLEQSVSTTTVSGMTRRRMV